MQNHQHEYLLSGKAPEDPFKPLDGHIALDCTLTESGGVSVRKNQLQEDEVISWTDKIPLDDKVDDKDHTLRLLFLSRTEGRVRLPFTLSKGTYMTLLRRKLLPHNYLCMYRTLYVTPPAAAVRSKSFVNERPAHDTSAERQFPIQYLVLVTHAYTACVSHIEDSRTTWAIIDSRHPKDNADHFVRALESAGPIIDAKLSGDAVLTAFLTQVVYSDYEQEVTSMQLQLFRCEKLAGFYGSNRGKRDLTKSSKDLTKVRTQLAYMPTNLRSTKQFLQLVVEDPQVAPTATNSDVQPRQAAFHEDMRSLGNRFDSLIDVVGSLSARADGLVQTIYSLIAQGDSQAGLRLAKASTDMAELSLRDNEVMKELAEQSRNIAVATKRDSEVMKDLAKQSKDIAEATKKDSEAMKVISFMTMVFLPGTFVASFFGTNFFDMTPGNKTIVEAKWLGLYFGITIGLTVVVFSAYWWPLHGKTKSRDTESKKGEA